MKTASLSTGQGSQYTGMGKDLADPFPKASKTFEKANQALGELLSQLC